MSVRAMIKKAAGVGGIALLSLSVAACGSHTKNLMAEMTAHAPEKGQQVGTSFVERTADFSVRMFQEAVAENKSTMVSPVSILAAMSMAASGASGTTLEQINEALYGTQDTEAQVKELDSWLKNRKEKNAGVFSSANSIWVKNNKEQFTPNEDYLQKNADGFGAEIYSSDFGTDTLEAINNWVKTNTNGMITKLLDRIDPTAVFQIINAVTFEDEWKEPYEAEDVTEGTFYTEDKKEKEATYLSSMEHKYIHTKNAEGVIKPYKNGYSFVAILPNEGESLTDYCKSLSGTELLQMITSAEETDVDTKLLKFKKETTMKLNDNLQDMGITDAFDPQKADFTKMGTSRDGVLYINTVLHKTFIEVNEQGTRASAVTGVTFECGAAMPQEVKRVELTRPFLYAIIEDETNLPVFMGTVTDV